MRIPSCAAHEKALWRVGRAVCVVLLVWGCLGCETLRERRAMSDNNTDDPRPRSEQLRSAATKGLIVSGVAVVVAAAALAAAASQEDYSDARVGLAGGVFVGAIAIIGSFRSIHLINQANAASHLELEEQIKALREEDEESAAIESLLMNRYGLGGGTEVR